MTNRNKRTTTDAAERRSAAQACKAFAACGNYPSEPEAQKLLADTLEAVCHAQQLDPYLLVQHCVQTSSWCPTPFDLRAAAAAMADERRQAPAGCAQCEGTGWVHSVRHVVTAAGEYDADYSGLCKCPLGEFIRQGERDMREAKRYGRTA